MVGKGEFHRICLGTDFPTVNREAGPRIQAFLVGAHRKTELADVHWSPLETLAAVLGIGQTMKLEIFR